MTLGKGSGTVHVVVMLACAALGGVACAASPGAIEEESAKTESALQPSCTFAIHPQIPLASSFTASETAVDDHVTGLHWIMTPGEPSTWEAANAHCASLGARLPTRMEISNIVDYSATTPDTWASPFPDMQVPNGCHWSSTPGGPGAHFAMGFGAAFPWNTIYLEGSPVSCQHRCVTGSICNPGADRDLSSTGADEVTSKRTGLRWKKRHIGPFDAASARTACPTGWRLPTVKELLTLVDDSRVAPAQAPVWQTKTFNEVVNGGLRFRAYGWETNEWAYNWVVDFATGINFTTSDSDLHWVRCVH